MLREYTDRADGRLRQQASLLEASGIDEELMEPSEKETYGSGIESFEGTVPLWLVAVSVCLTLWGIYYMIAYWNGPAAP